MPLALTSQRNCFDIVVSDISRCNSSVKDIFEELLRAGFTYYGILHDKDVDSDGCLIRPHLHIVLCSLNRMRVKQLINYLADTCSTNTENIQVMEVLSLVGSIQYLIHLNDCNKFQYDKKLIITNDERNLDGYLLETVKSNQVTTKVLIDYIFNLKLNRLELINAIGIGSYQHYRNTINDMYQISLHKPIK